MKEAAGKPPSPPQINNPHLQLLLELSLYLAAIVETVLFKIVEDSLC